MRQKRGLDADKKGPLWEGVPAKRVGEAVSQREPFHIK